MRKVLLGLLTALLIVLALGALGVLWCWDNAPKPAATPCERDCLNDSGGTTWCESYCKQHGTYGPAKK